jgi:hypothetical protein
MLLFLPLAPPLCYRSPYWMPEISTRDVLRCHANSSWISIPIVACRATCSNMRQVTMASILYARNPLNNQLL